ncbi:UDP-glycosyltransferase UGT5-like [Periplaneta americana]|uniref:UDP-glycosyltransferase UGT5-like n=1 Tax=Periplaneta americana TaxID=6978 RepID=UPI0037E7D910
MQWYLLLVLMTGIIATDAYKILCLFPHVAKSHFVMAEALMKGLAAKGHKVTVVSHFPQKTPIPNYTDISLIGSMPEFVNNVPLEALATGYVHTTINALAYWGYVNCENTLNFPAMKKLIASNEKYDLVVTELFNTDCLLGYVYKLQTPFIAISTSSLMPWANARFGNPDNPSYMGNHFLYHSHHMTFKERLINTLHQEGLKLAYHFMYDKPANEIARKHFGDSLPPLSEIAKNTSLLLYNAHFSLNFPRPLMPSIVEVGGIHVQPPTNKLPKDIKDFLDSAKDGVIYFSLGSSVRAESLPTDKRDAFVHAFSELPQKVLWKWEGETLPGKPNNVKTVSWVPQMDVLAHPNVVLFVTHGGTMGTMEAVSSGVPMVAIPLFGDQFHNVKCYVDKGIAVALSYQTLAKESVLSALKTVLNNPSFTENAKRVKKAFNDRPVSALDTAIYWTEYVIRHEGAPHLRSAAVDLAWYQYYLLDVLAVLFLAFVVVLLLFWLILKKMFSLCRRSKTAQKPKPKSKKN